MATTSPFLRASGNLAVANVMVNLVGPTLCREGLQTKDNSCTTYHQTETLCTSTAMTYAQIVLAQVRSNWRREDMDPAACSVA